MSPVEMLRALRRGLPCTDDTGSKRWGIELGAVLARSGKLQKSSGAVAVTSDQLSAGS